MCFGFNDFPIVLVEQSNFEFQGFIVFFNEIVPFQYCPTAKNK